MAKVVLGLFDKQPDADMLITVLGKNGYPPEEMSVITSQNNNDMILLVVPAKTGKEEEVIRLLGKYHATHVNIVTIL